MRSRTPLFVLLASSLTFLASLFLPWRQVTAAHSTFGATGIEGLLDLTNGGGQLDGWVSGAGDIAVLLVIPIVVASIATLRHPPLAARLPIASLGVALGYFAVAAAVEVHALSPILANYARHGFHTSWAYGFYLGLASAAVALLSGLAYRRSELRPRGAADMAAAALGIVLLASVLLPWYGFATPITYHVYGTELAAAVIVALCLILGAGGLHGDAARQWRLPVAIATAVLVGGAMSALPPTTIGATRVYGMWIAIASAVSLVVLEAVRAWPERVPALPRGLVAVRVGATALLIVALFLPWQEVHLPVTAGHWASGWYPSVGAAAGSLCLLLVATPALPKLANYALEAIVAIVLMVSVLATEFRSDSFAFRIGWGAFLGIAAAATLLVTVLLRVRPGRVNGSRALARPFRSHSPFSALPQLSSRPGSSFQRAGDTRRPP